MHKRAVPSKHKQTGVRSANYVNICRREFLFDDLKKKIAALLKKRSSVLQKPSFFCECGSGATRRVAENS